MAEWQTVGDRSWSYNVTEPNTYCGQREQTVAGKQRQGTEKTVLAVISVPSNSVMQKDDIYMMP